MEQGSRYSLTRSSTRLNLYILHVNDKRTRQANPQHYANRKYIRINNYFSSQHRQTIKSQALVTLDSLSALVDYNTLPLRYSD